MADNYLSFNYKNTTFSSTIVALSYFNGFIINNGTDLTFFNPSGFAHEFMTPQFANQSYFMGTTQENREFSFPILLNGVSMDTYKNFLRWLNPRDEGKLYFDYNSEWGYDVKVNSVSEGKFTVNNNCSTPSLTTYNIELTVGFITKNDYAATLVAVTSSTSLPSATTTYLSMAGTWSSSSVSSVVSISNTSGSTYSFYNYTNEDAYLKISSTGLTALSITTSAGLHYAISSTSSLNLTLYTEYGIALNNATKEFIAFTTNLGELVLPPKSTTALVIASTGDALSIVPVVREII